MSLPWGDVSRVIRRWRQVILERVGERHIVVSLRFTEDRDELYKAIGARVPLTALQAPDT